MKRKAKGKKINKRQLNQLTVKQRKEVREGKTLLFLMDDIGHLKQIN